MNFKNFIFEKQINVVSPEVDLILRECGFNLRAGKIGIKNLEFFKLIKYENEIIEFIISSSQRIYLRKNNMRTIDLTDFINNRIENFSISKDINNKEFINILKESLDIVLSCY